VARSIILDEGQFRKCLMSLSANREYVDWLAGRLLNDRDRGPCLSRMKAIFVKRLNAENVGRKVVLPQPAWGSR